MAQQVPELFGVTRPSEYRISHLSDNVLLPQFLRGDSELTGDYRTGIHHPGGVVHGEQFDPRQTPLRTVNEMPSPCGGVRDDLGLIQTGVCPDPRSAQPGSPLNLTPGLTSRVLGMVTPDQQPNRLSWSRLAVTRGRIGPGWTAWWELAGILVSQRGIP
jgi:hypothetical protein